MSDPDADAEQKPRVPLSDRVKPLINALAKIPNPAKVLPKKSHRVAAASGLSAVALGTAAPGASSSAATPSPTTRRRQEAPAATAPD